MKIILSPAKKMNICNDYISPSSSPVFLNESKNLLEYLRKMSYEELKALWKCNDSIAALNYERIWSMDLEKNISPALLSYEGIQYQYMAPNVFTDKQWEYAKKHVRILSGFYGVLKPLDGVVPYRLEMQSKISFGQYKSLYAFWGDKIYKELRKETSLLLNLASKEYGKCVEEFWEESVPLLHCHFGEKIQGTIKVKGTMAKMARGEMVRFLSEEGIEDKEGIPYFHRLGYTFSKEESTKNVYVFLKEAKGK